MRFYDFILKVKRRETPFYARLYNLIKWITRIEFPCVKPVHGFLYHERMLRRTFFWWLGLKLYYEPLFKSQCVEVGKNFRIIRGNLQGIPYIVGKPCIEIGNNVTMHSVITISGNKIYDRPRLRIGNSTYIGSRVSISVAQEVLIGDNCYLADNIIIRDNDGHPVDYLRRRENQPVSKDDIKPVRIGHDVWIGSGAMILKGVNVGDGAIIASGAIVAKNVSPFTIVAGPTANIVKKLTNRIYSLK